MRFLRVVSRFEAPLGLFFFALTFGHLDVGWVHLRDLNILTRVGQFHVLLRVAGAKGCHAIGHKSTMEVAELAVMVARVDEFSASNGPKQARHIGETLGLPLVRKVEVAHIGLAFTPKGID